MSALLTAQQTAEKLAISYSHFRHLMSENPENVPPYILIGTSKRWRESDIEKWLDSKTKALPGFSK